jgi:DNA-binding transcriptional regulator YdaS (Cro superfamily)
MAIVADMQLTDYIADTARRQHLARVLCASADHKPVQSMSAYLWQIATGWRGRRPSPEMASRIQSATDGAVTVADLRPDLAAAMVAAGYTRAEATPDSQPPTQEAA